MKRQNREGEAALPLSRAQIKAAARAVYGNAGRRAKPRFSAEMPSAFAPPAAESAPPATQIEPPSVPKKAQAAETFSHAGEQSAAAEPAQAAAQAAPAMPAAAERESPGEAEPAASRAEGFPRAPGENPVEDVENSTVQAVSSPSVPAQAVLPPEEAAEQPPAQAPEQGSAELQSAGTAQAENAALPSAPESEAEECAAVEASIQPDAPSTADPLPEGEPVCRMDESQALPPCGELSAPVEPPTADLLAYPPQTETSAMVWNAADAPSAPAQTNFTLNVEETAADGFPAPQVDSSQRAAPPDSPAAEGRDAASTRQLAEEVLRLLVDGLRRAKFNR